MYTSQDLANESGGVHTKPETIHCSDISALERRLKRFSYLGQKRSRWDALQAIHPGFIETITYDKVTFLVMWPHISFGLILVYSVTFVSNVMQFADSSQVLGLSLLIYTEIHSAGKMTLQCCFFVGCIFPYEKIHIHGYPRYRVDQ